MELLTLSFASFLFLPQAQAAGEVSSSNFYRDFSCGGQVPLDPGQAYHVTMGLGRLGCAKLCAQEEACLSYTTSDPDCLLYPVRLQTCGPSPSPPHASYYFKKCYNGGTPLTDKCLCPNHIAGDMCQYIMRNCQDWIQRKSTNGVYWVQPLTAPQPFQVYCQLSMPSYGGRTYVQKHYRTATMPSFNRTWEEYKEGFGALSSNNFWLGLQKLFWLTEDRRQTFRLQCAARFTSGAFTYPIRSYGHFRIGNESTGFEMLPHLEDTGSSLTDCLTDAVGAKFVTFDHGGSESLRMLAGDLGAGWWVKENVTKCNPNGRLKNRNEILETGDVFFQDLDSDLEVTQVYIFLTDH